MVIEATYRELYTIFRIKENIDINSDLSELNILINEHLEAGYKHFAVGFTKNSFLDFNAISKFIIWIEAIKKVHGTIAIIEANQDVMEFFSSVNDGAFIKFFNTEDDLTFHSSLS